MHTVVKNLGHAVYMFPTDTAQDHALFPCFSSPSVDICSFYGLFNATFFAFVFSAGKFFFS
jgi:hypothetical protein